MARSMGDYIIPNSESIKVPPFPPEKRWPGIDPIGTAGIGMSSLRNKIAPGFLYWLKAGGWGYHAGWKTGGQVWFSGGQFFEVVWVNKQAVGVVGASSLMDLMDAVDRKFTWLV